MEISAKNYAKLIGVSNKAPLTSSRNARRKKERKLSKELGKDFSAKQVKVIAQHDKRGMITITS